MNRAARVAPLLAIAGCLALAHAPARATTGDELARRWETAQHASIAAIHDKKTRVAAERRFEAERRALVGPPAAGPPASIGKAVTRELAVPGRYHLTERPEPPLRPTWWQQLWSWLVDRWKELYQRLFGRAKVGATQAAFIGYTIAALAALLLVAVGWRLVASLQFSRGSGARDVTALGNAPDASALYRAACRSADSGEFGHAAKLLFGAAVASLHLRGEIDARRSATVGELRRSLRARDGARAQQFDAIARPFVASAYAGRAVGGDEWIAARDAYLSIAAEPNA